MSESRNPSPDQARSEQLLAALRAGEEPAYEAFIRDNGARMLATARRLLRNDEDDARGAVQEAFLDAFRGLGSFRGGSEISTWLHGILVSAALMRIRRGRSRPEPSIEPLLPRFLDGGHHERPPTRWNDPAEAVLERTGMRALVREGIDKLPDSYRNVLMLRDIEGSGTRETAEILEISEGAVKVRLHRARQALRTLLDPHVRGVVT